MKRMIVIILSLLLLSVGTAIAYPPVPLSTGASAQEAMIEWEPESVKLYEETFFMFFKEAAELTSLTLNMEKMITFPYISGALVSLTTISCPNVTEIDIEGVHDESVSISGLSALTSVSFPKLVEVGSPISIEDCYLLSALDLSSLTTVAQLLNIYSFQGTSLNLSSLVTADNMTIKSGDNLTSIDLSSLVPTSGGEYDFSWNALTAASVNAILARFVANAEFVSGTIDLSSGTNAAPTGQGLTDVDTLRARGVTVRVNEE